MFKRGVRVPTILHTLVRAMLVLLVASGVLTGVVAGLMALSSGNAIFLSRSLLARGVLHAAVALAILVALAVLPVAATHVLQARARSVGAVGVLVLVAVACLGYYVGSVPHLLFGDIVGRQPSAASRLLAAALLLVLMLKPLGRLMRRDSVARRWPSQQGASNSGVPLAYGSWRHWESRVPRRAYGRER